MVLKAVVLAAIISIAFSAYTFPGDFKTCSPATSSNYPSCLIDLIQDTLFKLGTDGISSPIKFSINPIVMDFWHFHVKVETVDNHEYFWGLKHPTLWNSTVTDASFNSTTLTLTFTTVTHHLAQYCSRYNIWGQLYYDHSSDAEILYGSGTVDKHLYDVALTHTIVFVPGSVKGIDHYFVGAYDLEITSFGEVIFNYQNLYDGDTKLAARAVKLMNEKAKGIVYQQAEVFTNLLTIMLKSYTQTLINSVPASAIVAHLTGQ